MCSPSSNDDHCIHRFYVSIHRVKSLRCVVQREGGGGERERERERERESEKKRERERERINMKKKSFLLLWICLNERWHVIQMNFSPQYA